MSVRSRLKTESFGIMASMVFYGLIGALFLISLPFTNFPPHIGIIGLVSLVTAYGLFKKQNWVIWLAAAFFFIATTFALYSLYYVIVNDPVLGAGMLVYLALTWAATAYTISKRDTLER